MQSHDDIERSSEDPDVLAARGKVELAKAELESRLYQASDTGKRALARMAGKAKPALVVAAALVGVVLVTRLIRSRSRRRAAWRAPAEPHAGPSLFRVVLGAAIRGAVRVVATRVAEHAAARLVAANEEHELAEASELPLERVGSEAVVAR